MGADPFRVAGLFAFASAVAISAYFRGRAGRVASPLLTPAPDRRAVRALQAGSLILWVLVLVDPPWLAFTHAVLPAWVRWAGAAACPPLLAAAAWTLASLGKNITTTHVTRREHTLVTTGPYRWVRHPLYAVGLALYAALALTLQSWLVAAMAAAAAALLPLRVRREEAHLLSRFGAPYQAYRERTGALLPKLHR